jgi:release factor glutamine methyltransferase
VADAPATAGQMLALARDFLGRKQLAEARLDAELLVAHALGLDRLHLFLALDRPVTPAEVAAARELLVRRAGREPTAHLTGRREFYGRSFAVSRDVLVPRPESELLVDRARALLAGRAAPRVADVGTGSGCLAITLALELEGARVAAVDVSAAALALARANADRLGASVDLREGDGPRALADAAPFDVVVSNPPYVRPEEAAALEPEVREHEPALALFLPAGEPDHWLLRLLDEALPLLAPGGALLIELGAGQAPRALELARARGLAARCVRDLAGIERVLELAVPV